MGQYSSVNIPGLPNQFLQDQLSCGKGGQRNVLSAVYTTQTGQTTSYATGDDGNTQYGRLTDFFTLDTLNFPPSFFPNFSGTRSTKRFTNDKGGTVADGSDGSTASYMIDHAWGRGIYIVPQAADIWANAISAADSFTLAIAGGGTYTNWRLPNCYEILETINFQTIIANSTIGHLNVGMNYAPINIATCTTWTSNSCFSTLAFVFSLSLISTAKSNLNPYLFYRTHY